MELTFTAVYEELPESEGGGFMAYVEELPGANTQGETLDETRENLREAIQLILETNRELSGTPMPTRKIIREKITVPAA
jgi:predicted RNase H-like HicB family nuclease